MRTFIMYRRAVPTDTHDENQRNAPDQPQFEGVVWTDGTCTIRWLTAKVSTSVWASLDDMLAIHGHPEYGSELVWTARAKGGGGIACRKCFAPMGQYTMAPWRFVEGTGWLCPDCARAKEGRGDE